MNSFIKHCKNYINSWFRYPLIRFLFQPLINKAHEEVGKIKSELLQELLFKTHLSLMCANLPTVFSAMKNDPGFKTKAAEFRCALDEDSAEHFDCWLRKAKMLPRYYGDSTGVGSLVRFNIPHAAGLITAEELFVITNKDKILDDLLKIYTRKYNLEGIVPLSLHVHYYNNGLIYIPDHILERVKGTAALDCGAWIGDTALMVNEYGFSAIHCFEPNPSTFALLEDNVKRNEHVGKFICHNRAVSDKPEILTMESAGFLGGGARLSENGDIVVECIVLDDFWDASESVGLIKFDVEGFEEQALRGAEKLIRRYKPILLVAAYHEWVAPGQMFRLQKYIESLNLGYTFMFRGMAPEYGLVYEYDLICYVE